MPAEQGNTGAQFFLGNMYRNGRVIPKHQGGLAGFGMV